uniref:Uncharacterized protein n=1 Tax=Fagus sylvatica TaxID=28930 RepID=A0A2N9GE12_FAGSY
MAPGSRGAGAVFVCFSGEDSGQTGDATGEPRVARRSWSRYLSNAPGLAGQLFARVFDLAPDVGFSTFLVPSESLRCLLLQGSEFVGNPSLGPRDMVPRTEAAGVFLVRLRTVFRSGFRLDPVKSWRSESSTSCMNVSSFQRARACGSTCCESGRLCAQAWQRRWENSGNFSISLISSACFHALHRGELGFARYDLANRGRSCALVAEANLLLKGSQLADQVAAGRRESTFDHNSSFLVRFWTRKVSNRSSHRALTEWSRGGQFDSAFGLVNGPGQTLVKLGQSSPNSGKCIPDHVLRVSQAWWTLVGIGNGTAKNLPQFACHSLSDALALNRLTHGSKVKVGFRFLVFSQNSTFPTSAFSFPSSSDLALRKFVRLSELGSGKIGIRDLSKSQFGEIRRFGNPESKQVGRIWDLKFVPISNWAVQRCLTEAVVAEIVAWSSRLGFL